MREVKVLTWCDACLPALEPGTGVSLALDGGSVRELDLCDLHEKELLQTLRELVDRQGRPPEPVSRSTSPNQQEALPIEEDRPSCPVCSARSKSSLGLIQHAKNHHDLQVRALYGDECPFCDYSSSVLGAHAKKAHGFPDVVRLFQAAKDTDPRGVLAVRERDVWGPARRSA